ncbi:MAG: hypothetical protein IH851_11735 [Armatimonadetes bacterium]|nr:hypothetical protein [Armatimonadota bacterium]
MLILATAIGFGALGAAQAAPSPPLELFPLYAGPAAFNAEPGERMRLGSFVPHPWEVQDLIAAGVSLFVAETEELGPPDSEDPRFNWDLFAAQRESIGEQGGGWALSAYTTFPAFDDSLIVGEGTVNLLNGEWIPAWSPWNQERIRWSAEKFGEINRRFPRLEALTIGVFGEYGDASLFTGQARLDKAQANVWKSKLHTEPPLFGFWCGDPKALESWRRFLVARHDSVGQAYTDWGMDPAEMPELPRPVDPKYPYVARIEFMEWYRAGIPALVSSLSGIASEIFTETPILVPVGPPTDRPYLGLDVFLVAQAAHGKAAALKVTNVGFYTFALDWAMSLGRIRGAARAAGLPLWTEAPTVGGARDFNQRLFEALSLGSRGHIDWPQALRARRTDLTRILPHLEYAEPQCDVAVLHPTSSHVLRPSQPAPLLMLRGLVELRDYLDFDVLEESAVAEGALRNYRVAVLFEGTVWNPRTLSALRRWVTAGGVLLAYDFGKMADPLGNTAVYQELFGFASRLAPAKPTDRWVGDIPEAYRIPIGDMGGDEFLLGRWGPAEGGGRPAYNGAQLRLPVRKPADLTVTVSFTQAQEPTRVLDILLDGRKVAGLTLEGGLSRFQFLVDKRRISGDTLRLGFAGMGSREAVRVASVEVAEEGVEGEPGLLSGWFEAPVDIGVVRSSWSRRFGEGRVIFFPGRRDLWKQYISVVRHAVYRLSRIETGRENARLLDDRRDGLYMTDLRTRVALFNSTERAVAVSLPGPRAKDADVTVPAGRLVIASAEPPVVHILIQCEEFSKPGDARKIRFAVAKPRAAVNAVRVAAGGFIETVVTVPRAGRYRLFARTFKRGRPATVRFSAGEVDSAPVSAEFGLGDVYLAGEFDLERGQTTLRLSSDEGFVADLVVLTDAPHVVGYRVGRN